MHGGAFEEGKVLGHGPADPVQGPGGRFPGAPRPIGSTSRVVWCRKISAKGANRFRVGLEHIKIDLKDRDRFVFLFCETMLNYFLASAKKERFNKTR